MGWAGFVLLVVLTACTSGYTDTMSATLDSIADHALAWQYRNIDTLLANAQQMHRMAKGCGDADREAEALNLLALHSLQQLEYDRAMELTAEARAMTSNQVERLVADITQMRVAQRVGDNRAFFVHRSDARKHIQRIAEETDVLTEHQQHVYNRARADYHIVSSTYFYYLDQLARSVEEIRAAEPYCQLNVDTTAWLYYAYMRGSGGLSERTDIDKVTAYEFEQLFKCFTLAKTQGYQFFYANALQSLSTMFVDSAKVDVIYDRFPDAADYLTTLFDGDDVAMQMAFDALGVFVSYDDRFQSACVLRTIGELCFAKGDYDYAIDCYQEGLDYVESVPEYVAGVSQLLSLAYSAVGNKEESDNYRNAYLDLLELTQRDMEPEVRVEELRAESRDLKYRLVALVLTAIVVALLVWVLFRVWRKQVRRQSRRLRQSAQTMLRRAQALQSTIEEEQEELVEQQQATLLRIERSKRQNIEKHAKLQLVNSMVPLLDRITHEVQRMQRKGSMDEESLNYIDQLVERINECNAILTDWIRMEQGQLSLQLNTFDIAPLFEALRKARHAYDQKQLTLHVEPTDLSVKADRALTLFMLNTLAENARKFTPVGGTVSVTATAGESSGSQYVELSVSDTGQGMDQSTVDTIMGQKVFSPNLSPDSEQPDGEGRGFGFGLMNCKGIIEKYRKTNQLFGVCTFGVESQVGQGSRFFFRLPRVLTAIVAALMMLPARAQTEQQLRDASVRHAEALYYCNVSGRYAEGLIHADSAIAVLNQLHSKLYSNDTTSMTLAAKPYAVMSMVLTAEYEWAMKGCEMDYGLILGLRNEIAVAALVLHDWQLYKDNNAAYTRLYRWYHRDATIETFGVQMQRSHTNQRIAMVLIVLMAMTALLATYFFYYRPLLMFRKNVMALRRRHYDQMLQLEAKRSETQRLQLELLSDEHQRSLYEESRLHVQNQILDNCLSTIKHETMYYPSRIRRLVQRQQLEPMAETVSYYREVYSILCAQAAEQSAAVNFHRQRLTAQSLLEHAVRHVKARAQKQNADVTLTTSDMLQDAEFRGDGQALELLADALIDANLTAATPTAEWTLSCGITDDRRFARFELHITSTAMDEASAIDLFAPHADGTLYLLAKQVVREHDTYLGHPGCRIDAEPQDGTLLIWWTLPLIQ